MASNPGQPLPLFLTPGFQSYSAHQLSTGAPSTNPSNGAHPTTPKKRRSFLEWLPVVGGGIVGLFILGRCVTMVVNSNQPKEPKTVVSAMTAEEKFIRLTRRETSLPLISDFDQ